MSSETPRTDEQRVYEDAVMRFQEHISRADDGTFILNATDGRSIGIQDLTVFLELKLSLEKTNELIRTGEIDPNSVVSVTFGEDGKVRYGRV